MGEAKRRKKLDPNYGKATSFILPDDIWEEEDYQCYGERAEYFKDLDFHLNQGGAFEKRLPKYHQYKSVRESRLYRFIQDSVDHEEQYANYILSNVKSLSDLVRISSDLLNLIDKSVISKRNGNLNQAFKYYDQVFAHNQTWFMLWYGLAKLLCLFREYRMAFACIKICTLLYSKISDGRQYYSEHDLSYHFDQMYSLAIVGEENEPYLKSLGRPLNTMRILNANGRGKKSSTVSKIKVTKPKAAYPLNQEPNVPKRQYIEFPISPEGAWELNKRLEAEGLGWFYKEFMTQKNMLESRLYLTEVRLDIHPRITPKNYNSGEKIFSIPVVCFHPQSNIVKVLGIRENEIVLVSRLQYFKKNQQKLQKPQFWGCVRLVDDIALHYGYVEYHTWDSIDCSDDEECSLIVTSLRSSSDQRRGTVKTLVEREDLGISVNRVLIKVNAFCLNEFSEQEEQEIFVYLLDNSEVYSERINNIVSEKLGGNWFLKSWQEP
jgi:hypothetical protein